MSLRELNDIVAKTSKYLYDNEKFLVGVLAAKTRKIAQSYPTDQTILNMAGFLEKRANSAQFITRAELKDVYHHLYTNNNKFGEVFAEELGAPISSDAPLHTMKRDPMEWQSLTEQAYEKLADPLLTSALASVFDKTIPYRPYTPAAAKSAIESCAFELSRVGMNPKKLEIVAGRPEILLCRAAYETPKGESYTIIPIEMHKETGLLPNVFLSKHGFIDLSKDALTQHIIESAGKSYRLDVQKVLEVVTAAKLGPQAEPLNEVEQIVVKASAAQETPSYYAANNIVGQKVDEYREILQEPKFEQPAEFRSFEEQLTSKAGVAEFTLGKDVVSAGRTLVRQAMKQFGYQNVQIGISDSSENTVIYAVAIDRSMGFKVPVEIKNHKPTAPSIILTANGLGEFSKEGIAQVLVDTSNNEILASASVFAGQKPSDLIAQVRQAMGETNYLKAEDALNVLQSLGDARAYQTAYQVYVEGLKNKEVVKTASSVCSRQYKTASSNHLLCGHTNLPLHKVYQDQYGDCQPLYRKAMAETYEGATFMNAKIFWGD